MKLLWLCNVILPQVAKAIDKPVSNTGGWLFAMSESLSNMPDIEFHVCFAAPKGERYNAKTGSISYHSFTRAGNTVRSNPRNIAEFEQILREVAPDVIHVFGTEYAHSLDMVKAARHCGMSNRVVISIQGLVSRYSEHYCAYLPYKIVHRSSLRDILKRGNVYQGAKTFARRGEAEVAAIQGVRHVIGRTDWDKACALQMNPTVNYHFCNETLREEFYQGSWSIESCERHSLFVSQCSYPIKGMHLMLRAMAEIVKRFPDAHLYTTGSNPLTLRGIAKLKQTAYSKYLATLIRRYGLEKHVSFLGGLSAERMRERYLASHVFVSCSSIENSPNSLGEAMLLGTPCVSSDVGGVKNMMTHGIEGFVYPADEPYMIAYYVGELFESDTLAQRFSHAARTHAARTHNPETNLQTLIEIYREINGEGI